MEFILPASLLKFSRRITKGNEKFDEIDYYIIAIKLVRNEINITMNILKSTWVNQVSCDEFLKYLPGQTVM